MARIRDVTAVRRLPDFVTSSLSYDFAANAAQLPPQFLVDHSGGSLEFVRPAAALGLILFEDQRQTDL